MGLKFRKSFKVAPGVKLNLNKKSSSITFGGKGFHKTYNSSGKKATSVGIPGTGAYYTASSGGGSNSKKSSTHKKLTMHNADPVLTEDVAFQSNSNNTPAATLEKFTTEALKRYKTIFTVLSVLLFILALIGFAGGVPLVGIIGLAGGGFSFAMRNTYSKEIANQLLFSASTESGSGIPPLTGDSSGSNNKSPKKKMGCGCLTAIILFFIIIAGISSCSDSNDQSNDQKETKTEDTTPAIVALEGLTISADTDQTYDINTEVPVTLAVTPADANIDNLTLNGSECIFALDDNGNLTFSASEAGSYIVTVSCDGIESNSLTFNVEDKAAIAAAEEAQRQAEEEAARQAEEETARQAEEVAARQAEEAAAQQATQQSSEPQEEMVWISATGSKYHSRSSCGRMKADSAWQLPISEAQAQGYEPCKKCH